MHFTVLSQKSSILVIIKSEALTAPWDKCWSKLHMWCVCLLSMISRTTNALGSNAIAYYECVQFVSDLSSYGQSALHEHVHSTFEHNRDIDICCAASQTVLQVCNTIPALIAYTFPPKDLIWEVTSVCRGRKAFGDICKGLFSLHQNRIAHLDMKTCNCLFGQDGTCKISDLGLGKLMAAGKTNMTAEAQGTIPYMAPETMIDGRAGFSSDIWALSCIIWEVLTFLLTLLTEISVAIPDSSYLT